MKAKIKMMDVSSRFGIKKTDLTDDLFVKNSELTHICIARIQIYSEIKILNAEEMLRTTEYVIQLAFCLSEKYHFELKYLNFGGRFGIPYFTGETTFDAIKLIGGMQNLKALWMRLKKYRNYF